MIRVGHVDAPHFCAGVHVDPDGWIVKAAPILRYTLGWEWTRLEAYARKKRWETLLSEPIEGT